MSSKKIKIVTVSLVIAAVGASLFFLTNRTSAPALKTTQDKTTTTATQEKTQPSEPVVPEFNKTAKSIDEPASSWVVVNKARTLNPISYAPGDLTAIGGGQQIRAEAAASFTDMQIAAKAQGLTVFALSGYRSYETQTAVYNNEVKTNGQAKADSQSAHPGTSEHQTGWALDVGGGGCGIEDCFGTTAEGKWVAVHAYEYGFIIRYTAGKQSITGYRAEPWHLRYIGTDLSLELHTQNVTTLEEFFGLPSAPNYL